MLLLKILNENRLFYIKNHALIKDRSYKFIYSSILASLTFSGGLQQRTMHVELRFHANCLKIHTFVIYVT